MNEIEGYLVKAIRELSQKAEADDSEMLETDYLDRGIIDSLQLVEFITNIEDRFGVRFSHAQLESEEFRTLGGVASIISRCLGEEGKK